MTVYWTVHSLPELRDMPRYQARALYRQNAWKPFRHWPIWAAFVLTLAAVVGLTALLWSLGLRDTSFPRALLRDVPTVGVPGVVLGQVRMHLVRPYLRAAREDLT